MNSFRCMDQDPLLAQSLFKASLSRALITKTWGYTLVGLVVWVLFGLIIRILGYRDDTTTISIITIAAYSKLLQVGYILVFRLYASGWIYVTVFWSLLLSKKMSVCFCFLTPRKVQDYLYKGRTVSKSPLNTSGTMDGEDSPWKPLSRSSLSPSSLRHIHRSTGANDCTNSPLVIAQGENRLLNTLTECVETLLILGCNMVFVCVDIAVVVYFLVSVVVPMWSGYVPLMGFLFSITGVSQSLIFSRLYFDYLGAKKLFFRTFASGGGVDLSSKNDL